MPITLKVFRRNDVVACVQIIRIGGNRGAINDHPVAAIAEVAQRNGACVAHGVHPGELMETGGDGGRQVAGFGIGHPDLMGVDGEIHHVVRLETEIHGLHSGEAAHKQGSDHQQYQRTGDLQSHQAIAEPMPAGVTPRLPSCRTVFTFALAMRKAGTMPTTIPASNGDGKGIEEDAPIEVEHKLTGKSACRSRWLRALLATHAEHHAHAAADQRQQHALGDHLGDKPGTPGAQRGADRHLALARRSPHQTRLATLTQASNSTMRARERKSPAITNMVLGSPALMRSCGSG